PELTRALADAGCSAAVRAGVEPLDDAQVGEYVRASLARAGASNADLFTPEAIAKIARVTGGVPRLVNALCDASLTAAFTAGARTVDVAHVRAPGEPAEIAVASVIPADDEPRVVPAEPAPPPEA